MNATKIEWTDRTWIVDRDGRRVRTYVRKDASTPGRQLRRRMAEQKLAWCRGCRDWLPIADVRQGACKPHTAAEYRRRYAENPTAIRARVHARKRGIDPVPAIGSEALTETFEGRCAYCPDRATTWDHVIAVIRGGGTVPGNVVPACASCNSSKKDRDVAEWLARTGRTPHAALLDVLALAEVA